MNNSFSHWRLIFLHHDDAFSPKTGTFGFENHKNQMVAYDYSEEIKAKFQTENSNGSKIDMCNAFG